MGTAGVHLRPGRLGPGIGYWIAPWARGRGYAAEAHARWPTGRSGTARRACTCFADVGNAASQAVARRAGFTQEGVVRSCLPYRDGSRGPTRCCSARLAGG